MKNPVLVILLIILSIGKNIAQNQSIKDLDLFFDLLEEHNQFMGSVQLIHNEEVLYERSIGYSDIESNKKATAKTLYAIGSITKTYTATLILMAIEEGKIDLDTPIDNFFSELYNADKITIKELLQHRSGIPNITSEQSYLEWNTKRQSRDDMLNRMKEYTSQFEPGTHFSYSNSNYILLTYILEDLYKLDFAEILKEKITDPFGLKNTFFGKPFDTNLDVASSYLYQGVWEKQLETHYTVPIGAGAIFATVSDLNKFSKELFSGNILSAASMQHMLDINDGYGMGIITFPFYNMVGYGHSGGVDGFQSFFGYLPYENIGYNILSNGSRFSINDIGIALLSAATENEIIIPNFIECQLTEEEQEQYIGVYSSLEIPFKITVGKSNNGLKIQATGQPTLELDCEEEAHTFTYNMAGLKIIFTPEENSFRLFQSGGDFLFIKSEE